MKTEEDIPEYLVAHLLGEANEAQTALAVEWLKDPTNHEIYRQLEKISGLTSDIKLFAEFNVRSGKQRVRRKYRSDQIKIVAGWVQRVAAILFIPVMIGGWWFYLQQNELRKEVSSLIVNQTITTQPGTKTHLFLPDSTEVWLNAASTLCFPSIFTGSERRIELDGEAYFKVFKNKRMPFVVATKYQQIEAVGTAFNLSAYDGDLKYCTTLAEGKVKVTDREMEEIVRFLDPGFQLKYNTQSRAYHEVKVRVQDVIAWKDGILIFNETPFYEVAVKLGRWFNADIKITDQSIANYRFTGTFTDESLEQVLELLRLSTPIDYSTSQRKIQQNRSFSKQEIKIKRK